MADEKKLIYADDLICALRDDININGTNFARVKSHIADAPTVDAVEVVHGRWNEINQMATGLPWKYRCNKCGCPQDYKHNYCPNCGAKMDGDGNGRTD